MTCRLILVSQAHNEGVEDLVSIVFLWCYVSCVVPIWHVGCYGGVPPALPQKQKKKLSGLIP